MSVGDEEAVTAYVSHHVLNDCQSPSVCRCLEKRAVEFNPLEAQEDRGFFFFGVRNRCFSLYMD